ncbi:unnamed protein product [Camellia sinensis]
MVSLLQFSATIPFILSFLQFVSPSPTFLMCKCDNQFNYTQNNHVFQNNLNNILTNLSSETPLTNFYNSTFGKNKDTVYALRFCPAYIATQDCLACVQTASQLITQSCPNQKKAIIYYVECVVRYANYSFFSTEDGIPEVYWNSTTIFYNPDQLDQVMTNTMYGLISKAAFGSSTTTKFATGESKIISSSFQKLYCFAQCTPDINGRACRGCLQTALSYIQDNSFGNEWSLMYGPNCQMRYSLEAFYDVVSPPSPSLPPSGSTENTNINTTAPPPLQLSSDSTPSAESLQFDLGTIRDATDNFSEANKLGEGGFGPVYKGVLLNGLEIAVKKLSRNSRQGQEEFKNEVLLLARLRHKNLVRLLGFCLEGKELLLIYEFMPNKSLDHFISSLDWKSCKKIIQGFARGLLYLHEDSQHRIIHRDLKASNILLDAEMNPKISDFGTSRLMVLDQSHYTTSKIMGTIGYMAPEYFKHGHFSVKSDVFSFGVILLEILSGQKIFCFHDVENGENLLSYAWKSWKKNIALDIVDSTLMTGSKSEIMRCFHIGLLCIQENPTDRPTMASVVNMLISSSFTLSLPARPAYFVPKSIEPGNSLHEFNSMVTKSDQSEIKSSQGWFPQLGADVPQLGIIMPCLGHLQDHSWRRVDPIRISLYGPSLFSVRPIGSVSQLGLAQHHGWTSLSTAGWAQVLEELGELLIMKLGSIGLPIYSSNPLGFGHQWIGPAQGLESTHFTFSPFICSLACAKVPLGGAIALLPKRRVVLVFPSSALV